MFNRFLSAICALCFLWIAGCSSDDSEKAFPPIEELDVSVDAGLDSEPDQVEDLSPDLEEGLPPVTAEDVLGYVDSFIGTAGLGFSYGGLTPAAQAPLGMIRVGPDSSIGTNYSTLLTRFSGYEGNDPNVRGFSHLRFVGTGVGDYGNLRFLPTTREVTERPYRQWYSTFVEQDAEPGRYLARMEEGEVEVELIAGVRAAIHSYTFGDAMEDNIVVLDPTSSVSDNGIQAAQWALDGDEWSAELAYKGSYVGRRNAFTLWASVKLSSEPSNAEVWNPDTETWSLATQGEGVRHPARLTFAEDDVRLDVGISFQSLEQARKNREETQDGPEALLAKTQNSWRELLSRVLVEGGTEDDRVIFYTALYNAFRMPTRLYEDGKYRGLDGEIHDLPVGHDRYFTDLSLWDTYRTLHPLWTLIAPEAQRDALRSLILMAEDGGYIPRWPAGLSYTGGMEGEPAAILFGESAAKGLSGVDYQRAWDFLYPVSQASPPEGAPYEARKGIERYNALGFIPADEFSSSASNTLEWSMADQGLFLLAEHLGHTEDAAAFKVRASNWKNIYNPEEGFFWPRNADGSWAEFGSKTSYNERSGIFVEGSAWHYRFYPLHDPEGLAELMSADALETALDEFFEKSKLFDGRREIPVLPDSYYWHSNQPSIHTVAHYATIGRMDKLSHWTRQIQQFAYTSGKDGLPGNDDGGTMSSWFVFSAMGFYPIVGTARYVPMPPLFSKTTITLEDGDLVVEAPGASRENGLIGALMVNGEEVGPADFTHSMLAPGNTLSFALYPNGL